MELLNNPIFILLAIVIIGELIGWFKIGTFSLGSSAIIFAALIFGHYGFSLPPVFQSFGLVIFIYSIGVQAGPGFLSSFKSYGLKLSLGALVIVFLGAVTTLTMSVVFGFQADLSAGLFSGALTSTPGLAVASELARGSTLAPAGYGVAYSFGIIGVILFVKFIPRVDGVDIKQEEQELEEQLKKDHPPVIYKHYEIANDNLFNQKIDGLFLNKFADVSITRLMRKGAETSELPSGDTILQEGDIVRVVGTEKDLSIVGMFLGHEVTQQIEFTENLVMEKIVVSRPEVVGKTLRSLNLRSVYDVQVSRLTRNHFNLPANPNLRLSKGDVIYVVGWHSSIKNVRKLLGDSVTGVYTASVIGILLGIMLGYLISLIPITIPFMEPFSLGITGGVLMAGLILSNLKRTGPIVWEVPETANQFIRELGLMMFMAAVGTKAGSTIVHTIEQQGLNLVLAGVVNTVIPLIGGYIVCKKLLKIEFLRTLGVLTGGMTSTPGLAATQSISDTQYASTSYATVYPVALVGMILFTKLLYWGVQLLN